MFRLKYIYRSDIFECRKSLAKTINQNPIVRFYRQIIVVTADNKMLFVFHVEEDFVLSNPVHQPLRRRSGVSCMVYFLRLRSAVFVLCTVKPETTAGEARALWFTPSLIVHCSAERMEILRKPPEVDFHSPIWRGRGRP